MKRVVLFLTALWLSYSAMACINELQPIKGVEKPEQKVWELNPPLITANTLETYIARAEHFCGEDVKCSDLVIAQLYAGKYEEALTLSTKLAAKYPKQYEVVVTHAATLELNGKYKEALAMLNQAIEINPKSHKNSEWIHVRILEDRIAGGTKGSLLGLDFGSGKAPAAPAGVDTGKLLEQLHFQLVERIYFIPKTDTQFGSLLHDYADLLYVNGHKAAGRRYRDLAAEYGYAENAVPAPAKSSPEKAQPAEPLEKTSKSVPLSSLE